MRRRSSQTGSKTLPDNMLVCIALSDGYSLGILSSHIHVAWALAAGGTLEDRPRYNKTRCFDPFPFPEPTEQKKAEFAALAEELDEHRKLVFTENSNDLTLTDLYNVLDARQQARTLTPKEERIDSLGNVAILQ